MTTKKTFDSRLTSILKISVTPVLKEIGFKKIHMIYIRELEDLKWLIDVQKSLWNDAKEAQFTLNCGAYIPGVISTYSSKSTEPPVPKIEHCSCFTRVGSLTSEKKDLWWRITDSDSERVDRDIASDLKNKLETKIIPFLQNFSSPADVADFLCRSVDKENKEIFPLGAAQRLAYAGIIYWKHGDADRAQRTLNSAVEMSKKSPIEGIVETVKQKLIT